MDSLSTVYTPSTLPTIAMEDTNTLNDSTLTINDTTTKAHYVALSTLATIGSFVCLGVAAIAFATSFITFGAVCAIAGTALLVTAIYFAFKKPQITNSPDRNNSALPRPDNIANNSYKSVRKLSTNSKIENSCGSKIEDGKKFKVIPKDKPGSIQIVPKVAKLNPYKELQMKVCSENPSSIYIKKANESIKKEEKINSILGNGGCKRAIKISNDKALIIPNMDVDSMSEIKDRWPRIVHEEVEMSKFLNSIGLLGLQLQKVEIFNEQNADKSLPGYITDTFESLKNRNIYIMDTKNTRSSTWKNSDRLFGSIEDAKNIQNWKPFLDLLIKDIAKLIIYDLPVGGDSFNVAIVKVNDSFKIRYFGFDYTSKRSPISIPKEKIYSSLREELMLPRIKRAFSSAIVEVLFQEYGQPVGLSKEAQDLVKQLENSYSKLVLEEIKNLL